MEKKRDRLLYIDNIRWFMIILVVLMHLNVTYSNGGLWYYMEPGNGGMLSGLLFGMYGSWNQAYMMGLLFFIAGYFVPGSLYKKGSAQFINERLIRLGIPTLVYMLIIHPVTIVISNGFSGAEQNTVSWYIHHITSLDFLSTSGPLWFTFALLVFSIIYALVYKNQAESKERQKTIEITHKKVLAVIGITVIFAFVTRIFIPAGVPLFNNLAGNFMQLGYFPSYIVLFIAGTLAYRFDILSNLSYKFGRLWFRLALIIGIPLWFVVMIGGGVMAGPEGLSRLFGGFHWQSAAYSAWESFFAVGLTLGFIAIFREKFNTQGKFVSFLSDNAFGVYVFHAPILVAITMALRGIVMNPLAKMYAVALIVLPVCFIFSHLIRKVPMLKKIFS